jgi:hypothetical protein
MQAELHAVQSQRRFSSHLTDVCHGAADWIAGAVIDIDGLIDAQIEAHAGNGVDRF